MVRALLAGNKTQTRRILKPQPDYVFRNVADGTVDSMQRVIGEDVNGTEQRVTVPLPRITSGDRLYVRENFQVSGIGWGKKPKDARGGKVHYKADDNHGWQKIWGGWRPSIHMPRWASRLTLTVTDVRVEQLQRISQEDALAEGVGCLETTAPALGEGRTARDNFKTLWNIIHGLDAWYDNPWVVAYTFEVHHGNIDQMEKAHG